MLELTAAHWMTIGGTILALVILEGLLSADNALVLAVMVRHLPKHQQKRALRYGIIGAFVFRFIAVLLATKILDYWQFEVLGGVYLLYLAISHLLHREDHNDVDAKPRLGRGFWATVLGVELADIAFSIDSILAAVAMAEGMPKQLHGIEIGPLSVKDWVIYIGGVLGILTMRYVAGHFLVLLDRFQGLATGAYVLVGWIGLKLLAVGMHHALVDHHTKQRITGGWHDLIPTWIDPYLEMPSWVFWGGMALILGVSFLYKPKGGSSGHSPMLSPEELAEFGAGSEPEPAPSEPAPRG